MYTKKSCRWCRYYDRTTKSCSNDEIFDYLINDDRIRAAIEKIFNSGLNENISEQITKAIESAASIKTGRIKDPYDFVCQYYR